MKVFDEDNVSSAVKKYKNLNLYKECFIEVVKEKHYDFLHRLYLSWVFISTCIRNRTFRYLPEAFWILWYC